MASFREQQHPTFTIRGTHKVRSLLIEWKLWDLQVGEFSTLVMRLSAFSYTFGLFLNAAYLFRCSWSGTWTWTCTRTRRGPSRTSSCTTNCCLSSKTSPISPSGSSLDIQLRFSRSKVQTPLAVGDWLFYFAFSPKIENWGLLKSRKQFPGLKLRNSHCLEILFYSHVNMSDSSSEQFFIVV